MRRYFDSPRQPRQRRWPHDPWAPHERARPVPPPFGGVVDERLHHPVDRRPSEPPSLPATPQDEELDARREEAAREMPVPSPVADEAPKPMVESISRVRERIERDAQRQLSIDKSAMLRSFLEVADDLERAYEAAMKSSDGALRQGVELVRERFSSKLHEQGVTRIASVGEMFDPRVHEAVIATAVAILEDDGRVLRELRAGYRLGDEVLRPAAVEVGRRKVDGP